MWRNFGDGRGLLLDVCLTSLWSGPAFFLLLDACTKIDITLKYNYVHPDGFEETLKGLTKKVRVTVVDPSAPDEVLNQPEVDAANESRQQAEPWMVQGAEVRLKILNVSDGGGWYPYSNKTVTAVTDEYGVAEMGRLKRGVDVEVAGEKDGWVQVRMPHRHRLKDDAEDENIITMMGHDVGLLACQHNASAYRETQPDGSVNVETSAKCVCNARINTTDFNRGCRPGWIGGGVKLDGACYRLPIPDVAGVSWEEASKQCGEIGSAFLARIKRDDQQNFLRCKIEELDPDKRKYWTDGVSNKDMYQTTWWWHGTGQRDTFKLSYWHRQHHKDNYCGGHNEPMHAREYCMGLAGKFTSFFCMYSWYNQDCSYELVPLCQYSRV